MDIYIITRKYIIFIVISIATIYQISRYYITLPQRHAGWQSAYGNDYHLCSVDIDHRGLVPHIVVLACDQYIDNKTIDSCSCIYLATRQL